MVITLYGKETKISLGGLGNRIRYPGRLKAIFFLKLTDTEK